MPLTLRGPASVALLGQATSGLRSILAVARELADRISRARILGIAAEMAFWLFLALVPLATVAGLVAAKFAVQRPYLAEELLGPVPEVARTLLSSEVGKVAAWSGQAVAPTAIAIFVWLSSTGVHAIFDAMDLSTGGERPWWKKRLLAILTCIALSVGVAIVALVITGLSWMWRVTGEAVPVVADAESWGPAASLRSIAGALLACAMVCALFVIGVPAPARRDMPILPGAILVLLLEVVLGYGYTFYIHKAGTGSAYLAGLAAIGVTMTALYLASVALLVGLELNVMIRDRRRAAHREREAEEASSGGRG